MKQITRKIHTNARIAEHAYNCIVCNGTFSPSIKKQMFCGEECKAAVDSSRRTLDLIDRIVKGKQELCKECGTILSKPENIRRGYCCYECAATHRKRPGHNKKLAVSTKNLASSCRYCFGLLREASMHTTWGNVCSLACYQMITEEGGPNGVNNRNIHITDLKGDNNQAKIKSDHVEMYNRMAARRNTKFKSSVIAFKMLSDMQKATLKKTKQLEEEWFTRQSNRITVEVPYLAYLSLAAYNNKVLGIQFLMPIMGENSGHMGTIKRSFIYTSESYEYQSSTLILRSIPCIGNCIKDGYRLYETSTHEQMSKIDEMISLDGLKVSDFEPRFAGQFFNDKKLRKELPGFEPWDENNKSYTKTDRFTKG